MLHHHAEEFDAVLHLVVCDLPGCVEDVFAIGSPLAGVPRRLCLKHWQMALDYVTRAAEGEQELRKPHGRADHLRIYPVGEPSRCAYHGAACEEGFGWQFDDLSPIEQYQFDSR